MEPIIFVHTPTGDLSVYPDKVYRKVGLFRQVVKLIPEVN